METRNDGTGHAPQCMCDRHDNPAIEAERAELAAAGITIGKATVRKRPAPVTGFDIVPVDEGPPIEDLIAAAQWRPPTLMQRVKGWFRRDH